MKSKGHKMNPSKTVNTVLLLCGILLIAPAALLAATFTNLDFEAVDETTLNGCPFPLCDLSMAYAFPGWSGFTDTNPLPYVLYGNLPIALAACIILCDTNPTSMGNTWTILEGDITILLGAGPRSPEEVDVLISVSIAQTGRVPSYAQTLKFLSTSDSSSFKVEINTNVLAVTPRMTNSGIITYTADIAGYADQEVEFKITALAPEPPALYNFVDIDDIEVGWCLAEIWGIYPQVSLALRSAGEPHATAVVINIENKISGITNVIERSATLLSNDWEVVHTYPAEPGSISWTQSLEGNPERHFFRIRQADESGKNLKKSSKTAPKRSKIAKNGRFSRFLRKIRGF